MYNYIDNGQIPDGVDISLWGVAFAGGVAAPATISVSLIKSVVDDDIERKLKQVRQSELPKYRDFIFPCKVFSHSPAMINSFTIASKGGTSWMHTNGLWVYILDANKKHLHDFRPKEFIKGYQPDHPLVVGKNGLFRFSSF